MTESFKRCPQCGARVHPIAGRCKQCKANVEDVPVERGSMDKTSMRRRWLAAVIAVVALGAGAWLIARGRSEPTVPPPELSPGPQRPRKAQPWRSNIPIDAAPPGEASVATDP